MSDSDDEVAEKQFKICLVGEPNSGKSSLASRYSNDTFTKNTVETVGVEFYLKRTELQGNRHITLKVRPGKWVTYCPKLDLLKTCHFADMGYRRRSIEEPDVG